MSVEQLAEWCSDYLFPLRNTVLQPLAEHFDYLGVGAVTTGALLSGFGLWKYWSTRSRKWLKLPAATLAAGTAWTLISAAPLLREDLEEKLLEQNSLPVQTLEEYAAAYDKAIAAEHQPPSQEEQRALLERAYQKLLPQLDDRASPVIQPGKSLVLYAFGFKKSGLFDPATGEYNYDHSGHPVDVTQNHAHELAHLMGYPYEDEAEVMSILALLTADDPYLRMCGLHARLDLEEHQSFPAYLAEQQGPPAPPTRFQVLRKIGMRASGQGTEKEAYDDRPRRILAHLEKQ